MRALAVLLLTTTALLAQAVSKEDLLKQTSDLEELIAAGEWEKAAELSGPLKAAVAAARDQSLDATGRVLADSILDWLPADTQTLVVAQKPFPIAREDRTNVPTALGMAQGYVLGPLAAAEKGDLAKALLGRTVRLAALGARHFGSHPPDADDAPSLGLIGFEGCGVYAFADPLPGSMIPRPPDDSEMGRPVWVSKGSQNVGRPDTETYLVSLLEPDLMVVCNSRPFFQEMVLRKGTPHLPRALPAALPEWKLIDRSAPLWAICHYGDGGSFLSALGMGDDEIEAAGIALEFGLPSNTSRARAIAKSDPWKDLASSGDFHGAAGSRKIADGVWELSISGNPEAAGMAAFTLMAMVGFIVLL